MKTSSQNNKEYNLPIYHDARRYDDEYWWKKDDIEFWRRHYKKHVANSILEVACGTGRIGVPLAREHVKYHGLDISKEFLKTMQEKLDYNNLRATITHGDMRSFNLKTRFDFIFIGFNSLLHLLTDNDILSFLKSIKLHCHANTIFTIDVFVPHPLFLYRPQVRYPTMEYVDSETKEIISVEEISNYDSNTEINEITWFYSSSSQKDIKVYKYHMRMLYPDTINRLLMDSGFEILNMYGDYNYNEFTEESQYQIYDCKIQ